MPCELTVLTSQLLGIIREKANTVVSTVPFTEPHMADYAQRQLLDGP